MKTIAAASAILLALAVAGCTGSDDASATAGRQPKIQQGTIQNAAGTSSAAQPTTTKKSKDLGETVKGATDRAQELTDQENKRVDEVNEAMDQ